MGLHNNGKDRVRTPPFTLAFGIDTIALTELIRLTTRICNYNKENNDTTLLMEHVEREEMREHAILKELEYKRKMAQYHDTHISGKGLKEKDVFVL